MADNDTAKNFRFQLASVERRPWKPGYVDSYLVTFRFERESQIVDVPIWVWDGETKVSDVVRVAMHRLHLVLAGLSSSTESLRLSDEEYAALVPQD